VNIEELGEIAYANEVKCSFAHLYLFPSLLSNLSLSFFFCSASNNGGSCEEGGMAGYDSGVLR
jgi:hypothetical protein